MWLTDDVFCCHGTPTSDLEYFVDTVVDDAERGGVGVRAATLAEATARAGSVRASLILCGHTHQARCVGLADGRLVVNPGSIGVQAYDDEHPHPHRIEAGSPHARYAIAEQRRDGRWQVELRHVPYDSASRGSARAASGATAAAASGSANG